MASGEKRKKLGEIWSTTVETVLKSHMGISSGCEG